MNSLQEQIQLHRQEGANQTNPDVGIPEHSAYEFRKVFVQ